MQHRLWPPLLLGAAGMRLLVAPRGLDTVGLSLAATAASVAATLDHHPGGGQQGEETAAAGGGSLGARQGERQCFSARSDQPVVWHGQVGCQRGGNSVLVTRASFGSHGQAML